MCELDDFQEDNLKKYSRRDVGALAAAVSLAAMLPRAAHAVDVKESDVTIKTPDDECNAYFVTPTTGAHAAVLVWPDIFGLRPAFRQMGKRLAEEGYSVLTVNPFYRMKKAPTASQGAKTPFPEVMPQMQSLTAATNTTDAKAFIAWLDQQPQVDKNKKIGTTGYCMGGFIVLRTAAAVPNRVGAGATFHGAALVTKAPDSPHLLIPQMKASFLIAVAENDDKTDPEAKNTLKKAFDDAKLKSEVEVYPAAHGWCPPDTQVYNMEAAEKAWGRMLALFKTSLA